VIYKGAMRGTPLLVLRRGRDGRCVGRGGFVDVLSLFATVIPFATLKKMASLQRTYLFFGSQ